MNLIAAEVIDWDALLDVVLISAFAGLAIALTLGLGIVSNLRAEDRQGGGALALNAVTAVSVLIVGAALVVGIYYMTDK